MINDMFQFYEAMKKDKIIFCFSGPTSQGVVEGIGEALRQKMELETKTQRLAGHVFSIFVEQMQNVLHYSAEKAGGDPRGDLSHGILVVGRLDSGEFYISTGNYVHKDDTERIVALLDKMKDMDKAELKAFYKEERRRERREGSKGAGLGMIETARKATRPLEYTLSPSDDGNHDFISIKAVI